MPWKKIAILILGIFLAASLTGIAAAQDDEEESPDVTYLDDAIGSKGWISFIFKLSEEDEDSAFFGRYHDPFEGDSFFLEGLDLTEWSGTDSIFTFGMGPSWSDSWSAHGEWRELGDFRFFGSYNTYDHFQIPTGSPAERTDSNFGFQWGEVGGNVLDVQFNSHEKKEALIPGAATSTIWDTTELNVDYSFDMAAWDSEFGFRRRVMDANEVGVADIEHTSWTFRVGQQVTDQTFLQGSAMYNESKVTGDADAKNFRLSGYARSTDALGMDDFDMTSHINWEKRNNGPSRMHPTGDLFDFDIKAKWRASDDVRMYGSWKTTSADKTHPNRTAINEFYGNHDLLRPVNGTLIADTVQSNLYKFGGRIDLSEELSAKIDFSWLSRHGMDNTDIREAGSPYLLWNNEDKQVYSLRYRPEKGSGMGTNDWELKYTKKNRSNGWRPTSNDNEHFTLNWTGMCHDDMWFYIGGGFLRTNSTQAELITWEQKGTEYSFGFDWMFNEEWSFFTDYWNYEVSGADGYDQRTLRLGIDYEPDEDWGFGLEYQDIDGDFDVLVPYDFNLELLLLRLFWNW